MFGFSETEPSDYVCVIKHEVDNDVRYIARTERHTTDTGVPLVYGDGTYHLAEELGVLKWQSIRARSSVVTRIDVHRDSLTDEAEIACERSGAFTVCGALQ